MNGSRRPAALPDEDVLRGTGQRRAGSPCHSSRVSAFDDSAPLSQEQSPPQEPGGAGAPSEARDIAEVPAAEVIASAAVHLMSAAAVKCGLAEEGRELQDLDEARKLITALAGLVSAARPDLGVHAAPLRDGLQALQRAFREASTHPDAPGEGPGERLTGPA